MKQTTTVLFIAALLAAGASQARQTAQPPSQADQVQAAPKQPSPAQPPGQQKPADCTDPKLIKKDGSKRSKLWEKLRSKVYQKTGEDPNVYVKPQGCPDDPAPAQQPQPKPPSK
jgi:hypothetical protein